MHYYESSQCLEHLYYFHPGLLSTNFLVPLCYRFLDLAPICVGGLPSSPTVYPVIIIVVHLFYLRSFKEISLNSKIVFSFDK
jgi:hypothetical protein